MVQSVGFTYETLPGNVTIVSNGSAITSVQFETTANWKGIIASDVLTDKAAVQLEEYFAGKRKQFDLPLCPSGTVFQQAVWEALMTIPYGETRSYKQVAQVIDKSNACRAVGMANNRNPIMIMIPCHRVIGGNGTLVGYGGGLEMKKWLLDLEKSISVTIS